MNRSLFFTLAFAAGLFAGCAQEDAPEGDAPADADASRAVPVEVVLAEPLRFEDRIELTGSVKAPNDAVLSAESAGRLTYLAELGRSIGAGQTVARVDGRLQQAGLEQAQASLAAAEAQAALAEDQFRRQEGLYRDSILSALEFEAVRAQRAQAQAQVAQARAAVSSARTQAGNTVIAAPFAGTVEAHLADRGETVGPGTPIVRLVAASGVRIEAGVPEIYANEIQEGTEVQIEPSAYGAPPMRGTVVFSGRAIDPQSRTSPIEIAVDNRAGLLKPAMTTRLYVTRRVVEGALAVPLVAIERDERGEGLYVALEAGGGQTVAERRDVTTGARADGRVVIETGLAAGERVIVNGQSALTTGDAVRIVETQPLVQRTALSDTDQ
jgi:membrane fusion protein (multidrug efflux system)